MHTRGNPNRIIVVALAVCALAAVTWIAHAASSVPTEIQQPGTQPGEAATYQTPDNCDNCHDDASPPQNRQYYPNYGWRGGMMANASRDPIFWATLAVAEQDFLPAPDPNQRGGAGDLCLRCHTVNGWMAGRSTPTDGSGMSGTADTNGVECEFCHLMVNPDPPVNVSGTVEAYTAPFEAYDLDGTITRVYRGSGQYVINSQGTRLGPFTSTNAKHAFFPSPFHRQGEFCGTCHDVSNAAVGDLAHNNGAQLPLPAGAFSGVPGSAVDGDATLGIPEKAAFQNPPYAYGMVERTFTEWVASALDTFPVNSYGTLPAELRVAGGALDKAYHRAYDARSNANYEDGTTRTFTCQTCHMYAVTGLGCNKTGTPTRTDLPIHDQTGSGYWMPDALLWQEDHGRLRFGTGLTTTQRAALADGKTRAVDMLQSAASVTAVQDQAKLEVDVTNLSGHKLISGYPEGRRMWLNIVWKDSGGATIAEDGAYGLIGRSVADLDGTLHQVQSLIDPDNTVVYEAGPGMDQQWAGQLVGLGYDPTMALTYDRMTDAPEHTLGELAASPSGTAFHSFHFVLNNFMIADNRIPPYGFSYDEARTRNALPVPETQYGNPGAGGTYEHTSEVYFDIPPGAHSAEVRLRYQQTSWEYVQFLWLQNDGLNTFLGNEGDNMLDAWLNTGMSPPLDIRTLTSGLTPVAGPVSGLLFVSKTGFSWSPAIEATRYDVMRGSLAALRANGSIGDASCLIDDLTGTSATDTAVPAPGEGYYYLVRGDGATVVPGTLDTLPATAGPGEGRDAEAGTAGGSVCGDLP